MTEVARRKSTYPRSDAQTQQPRVTNIGRSMHGVQKMVARTNFTDPAGLLSIGTRGRDCLDIKQV